MRLAEDQARARLAAADHGVLATMHATRGADLVPVVFALDDAGRLGVPVDTVKPKASTDLQRERNLAADPRASLLVEHWDAADWSRLWWVRAELGWDPDPATTVVAGLAGNLALRYGQYADRPFARLLVFRVVAVTGWSAR